ncbi:MAG: hypothetical protein LBU32_09405 [Clostridiales bacterium]|nr:hypothetical protein [Clostridiales bacterium]
MPAKSFDQEAVDAEIFADLYVSGGRLGRRRPSGSEARIQCACKAERKRALRKWSACWRGWECRERLQLR